MINNLFSEIPVTLGIIVIGLAISVYCFYLGKEEIKEQAIINNCAQYNPTNGLFEWKPKNK